MTDNPMVRLAEIMIPVNAPFDSDDARKVAVTTARDSLAAIVAEAPDFFHARYFLGVTEAILGNNAAAVAHFYAVLPYSPSTSVGGEVCYNIAAALRAQGDPDAKRYFAVARDLTDDPTLSELATEALRALANEAGLV